mmetsp:Transcript_109253/g.273658  ORF Transcript_109253/g.273658 Transcript_109253/m.273658 type:complete len:107 (-) Transcript_109253:504-824(-)
MINKRSTMAQQRCERVDKMEAIRRRSGMMKRSSLLILIIRPIRVTLMMRKDGEFVNSSIKPPPSPPVLSATTTEKAAMSRKETKTKQTSKAFQNLPGPRQKSEPST